MHKALSLLLILGLISTAFADSGCPDVSGLDRNECLEKQLKAAEAELKQVMGKVVASIGSKDSDFIPQPERDKWKFEAAKAQRSWQAYRDTECQAITPYFWWGGSGSGISGAVVECLLLKTEARVSELRQRYPIAAGASVKSDSASRANTPSNDASQLTGAQKMDMALRDLQAGRSLPGLPNLKKAVFVAADSLICTSPNALANPNIPALLMIGACIVSERRTRIVVYPPRDTDEYLNDYVFEMVSIGWRSNEISNGSTSMGWVKINRLEN